MEPTKVLSEGLAQPAAPLGDEAPPIATPLPPSDGLEDRLLPTDEIERALGISLDAALDLKNWDRNGGLEGLLRRVPNYIFRSVREESRFCHEIRKTVLNRLSEFLDAPTEAGVYMPSDAHIRAARRGHLLCGQVAAADGACTGHDGLVATVVAIGVAVVRYDGRLNSWTTTFIRDDYGLQSENRAEEIHRFLDRRGRRSDEGPGANLGRDQLSELLRRGFMAAAERRALLEETDTPWRVGHGTPAPMELLTGSGSMALIDKTLPVLEELLLKNKRWVFIPNALANLALSTLANALDAGQVAIFQKAKPYLDVMVQTGTYAAEYKRRVLEFAARAGEAMVVGGFKATPHAPAQLFVAHAEHAVAAGILAMTDASFRPYQGFPLLLSLAGENAKTGLGVEAFKGVVESAYAKAGASSFFSIEQMHKTGGAS